MSFENSQDTVPSDHENSDDDSPEGKKCINMIHFLTAYYHTCTSNLDQYFVDEENLPDLSELNASDQFFCNVSSDDIEPEARPEDQREADTIDRFMAEGCKCPLNCSLKFSRPHYELTRSQCAELTHETLDMVIMGQLMALTPVVPSSDINITHYMHQGEKVRARLCKCTK